MLADEADEPPAADDAARPAARAGIEARPSRAATARSERVDCFIRVPRGLKGVTRKNKFPKKRNIMIKPPTL
jgi:hypothetical protein